MSNGWTNGELERIWKEATMALSRATMVFVSRFSRKPQVYWASRHDRDAKWSPKEYMSTHYCYIRLSGVCVHPKSIRISVLLCFVPCINSIQNNCETRYVSDRKVGFQLHLESVRIFMHHED